MTSAHAVPARSWAGGSRAWLERLWASIADRGRTFVALPALNLDPLSRARALAHALLSERGEASGAAVSRALRESRGLMVNYLYDPAKIEAYHEAFVGSGKVARSPLVDGLMAKPRKSKSGTAK